jgi:hypothetical protein
MFHNLVAFIGIFNLGEKIKPELNEGIGVDGITRGSFVCPKYPKSGLVHCRAEDITTHFLETQT